MNDRWVVVASKTQVWYNRIGGIKILAGRDFILEGDEETTDKLQGKPITEGQRSVIAKGHFGELEKPIITWINGKGDLKNPKEYRSTHDVGSDFPDATIVRLPETDQHFELVLAIFPLFEGGSDE